MVKNQSHKGRECQLIGCPNKRHHLMTNASSTSLLSCHLLRNLVRRLWTSANPRVLWSRGVNWLKLLWPKSEREALQVGRSLTNTAPNLLPSFHCLPVCFRAPEYVQLTVSDQTGRGGQCGRRRCTFVGINNILFRVGLLWSREGALCVT